MIEIKDLTITLAGTDRVIAEKFSFTLKPGDKAVIIGEEGDGKSTLLKYLYQPGLVEDYCICQGTVARRGKAGYLPQMMDGAWLTKTVEEYFSGADVYSHWEVMNELDIPWEFITSHQKIATLSGGEKVKIQMARLLMEEPDVLLLDEPTNDIDLETLRWMETFLQNTKIPVLYVSHDEMLIERTANVIIHMEQLMRKSRCRITVTRMGYREYLEYRNASFEKQDQIAGKQRADYERQMEKWRQIYNRVDHEQKTISRQNPGGAKLLKKKMKAVLSQGRRMERQAEEFQEFSETEEAILAKFSEKIRIPNGKVILDFSLEELKIGERILAEGIRLRVTGGEHVGIVGKNGVGKSTLLAAIWEELKERRDIRACLMPQDYGTCLDDQKTPVEYLAEQYSKSDVTKARTYLGGMRFTREEMTGKIGNLSGGQKAKLLFLDMVLKNADVLVLDEPTRNFSPLSAPAVRSALREFQGAVISISHDRKYLEQVCHRVYRLTSQGLAAAEQDWI